MPDDKEPEDPHPDFVKGFNEGYQLAQHAPEIGGIFGAYAPETERGQGFRKGKDQLALDRTKERRAEYRKDASDNLTEMGVKENTEKKIADFKEWKTEQGLDKPSLPSWLTEKDENKGDMDLDPQRHVDKDIEPTI